jgi:hypothetical protein
MRLATYLTGLFSLLIFAALLAPPTAMAKDAWYPAQIDSGHRRSTQGISTNCSNTVRPVRPAGRGTYALQFRASKTTTCLI